MRDLTKEEESAIRRLKSLAKVWPKSLWLFSGGTGELNIMRTNKDGEMAHLGEGVDPAYIVDSVKINSDGGDW